MYAHFLILTDTKMNRENNKDISVDTEYACIVSLAGGFDDSFQQLEQISATDLLNDLLNCPSWSERWTNLE